MDNDLNVILDQISKNPINPDLYYFLAQTHRINGNTNASYVACVTGLSLLSTHIGLLYEMSIIGLILNYEKSFNAFELIILSPNISQNVKDICKINYKYHIIHLICDIKIISKEQESLVDISNISTATAILTKNNIHISINDIKKSMSNNQNFNMLRLIGTEETATTLALVQSSFSNYGIIDFSTMKLLPLLIETANLLPFMYENELLLFENNDTIIKPNLNNGTCKIHIKIPQIIDTTTFKTQCAPIQFSQDVYFLIIKDTVSCIPQAECITSSFRFIKLNSKFQIMGLSHPFTILKNNSERITSVYYKNNEFKLTICVDNDQWYICTITMDMLKRLMK